MRAVVDDMLANVEALFGRDAALGFFATRIDLDKDPQRFRPQRARGFIQRIRLFDTVDRLDHVQIRDRSHRLALVRLEVADKMPLDIARQLGLCF